VRAWERDQIISHWFTWSPV